MSIALRPTREVEVAGRAPVRERSVGVRLVLEDRRHPRVGIGGNEPAGCTRLERAVRHLPEVDDLRALRVPAHEDPVLARDLLEDVRRAEGTLRPCTDGRAVDHLLAARPARVRLVGLERGGRGRLLEPVDPVPVQAPVALAVVVRPECRRRRAAPRRRRARPRRSCTCASARTRPRARSRRPATPGRPSRSASRRRDPDGTRCRRARRLPARVSRRRSSRARRAARAPRCARRSRSRSQPRRSRTAHRRRSAASCTASGVPFGLSSVKLPGVPLLSNTFFRLNSIEALPLAHIIRSAG